MAIESPVETVEIAAQLRTAGCVFADEEARIIIDAAETPDDLAAMVAARVAGRPLEHIVGWAEFYGVRIAVGPGVFVPRRRTEFLVAQAVALTSPGDAIVDLCCGSGALGLAVASVVQPVTLFAADIDTVAVEYARRNLAPVGGQVSCGDLFSALPHTLRGSINVLMANVPYVPSTEIDLLPAEARVHEPRAALDGGSDGLDVQRRVAAGAGEWLGPGGCLLVEVSERQASAAARAFDAHGLRARVETTSESPGAVVVGLLP